ncbi:NADH-quinone oxidoreductase subunit 5 family protein [Wenjunlia tyrosinilytica]|uniref:NADH dehydrogenase n=1 Tax=Wenjunlia tyrosinilytica TaxID=1544741 RepID=A0A917ZL18_9ACTN|nr:NADH-quinone oxidoreductase subunit L [Wenjunlia tyrosinilytica]GGO83792.1 NADH dehydrogenase [Wenjunlia tyrosinilytica]
MTVTLAVLVPLLPFLGGVAGLLLGRVAPGYARPLAVLPTLFSLALAVTVLARQGSGQAINAATQLTPTGAQPIDLSIHLDGFATLPAVLVGVVASCVQIYSTGYLRDDPRYPSYAALVSLFTSAMLLVVYSGDLIVLLVGWEIMGICSYFLVGHYWETEAARSASIKAFLVTKLGDVPFLFGIFALADDAGTFRIQGVLDAARTGHIHHPTLIALLLLGGVAGKSAQFPLHTWLPDAMAGPTPVSALIHAATMVAAGVYLVARLLPVFLLSSAALAVLAVMAAVTMIGSALCALAQDDIKRVLAYSTIGQLGYMTGALAVGDRGAAMFHLLTHGAFKALLFLGAGVVIHAAGTNSLTAMSRMSDLRRRIPDAFWTMTVGLAALAALFPFSGFFSKEAVLRAAETAAEGHLHHVPSAIGWTVLVAGLLTAMLTAAYATRLWLRTFMGSAAPARPTAAEAPTAGEAGSGPDVEPVPEHTHEPAAMRWPLWVLFIPALGLGTAVGVLPDYFDGGSLSPTLITSVLGMGLALVGILVTYAAWRAATEAHLRAHVAAVNAALDTDAAATEAIAVGARRSVEVPDPADPGQILLGPLHGPAAHGFHLDAVYYTLFVRPVLGAASLVRFLDRDVVETYVRGAGLAPRLLGTVVRRAQTGNVQTYLSALLAGAVVLAVLVAVGA